MNKNYESNPASQDFGKLKSEPFKSLEKKASEYTGTINASELAAKEPTFFQRLLNEKQQLDSNIGKLSAFLISKSFDTVAPEQKSLLGIQLKAMETYSLCLKERIALLN